MFCPKCGQEANNGDTFCGTCGTRLDNRVTPSQNGVPAGNTQPISQQSVVSNPVQAPTSAAVSSNNVYSGQNAVGYNTQVATSTSTISYSAIFKEFMPIMFQYTAVFLISAFALASLLILISGAVVTSIAGSSLNLPLTTYDPRYAIVLMSLFVGGSVSMDLNISASMLSEYGYSSNLGSMNGELIIPILTLAIISLLIVCVFGRKFCKANTPMTFAATPLQLIINAVATGIAIAVIYSIIALLLPYNMDLQYLNSYFSGVSATYSGLSFRTFAAFMLWGFVASLLADWLRKASTEGETIRTCIREITSKLPVISNIWSILSIQLVAGFIAFVATSIWVFANIPYHSIEVFFGVLAAYLFLPVSVPISAIVSGSPLSLSGSATGAISSLSNGTTMMQDYSIFDFASDYANSDPGVPVLFIWFISYIVLVALFAFARARHRSAHNPMVPGKPLDGKSLGLFLAEDAILWVVLILLTQFSFNFEGIAAIFGSSSSGTADFFFSVSFSGVIFGVIFALIAELLAIYVLPSLTSKAPVLLKFQNSSFVSFLSGCPKGGRYQTGPYRPH